MHFQVRIEHYSNKSHDTRCAVLNLNNGKINLYCHKRFVKILSDNYNIVISLSSNRSCNINSWYFIFEKFLPSFSTTSEHFTDFRNLLGSYIKLYICFFFLKREQKSVYWFYFNRYKYEFIFSLCDKLLTKLSINLLFNNPFFDKLIRRSSRALSINQIQSKRQIHNCLLYKNGAPTSHEQLRILRISCLLQIIKV